MESGFGECEVTVPAAQSADGMPIVLYRAYAKNKAGVIVETTWTLPQYYRAVEQNEIVLTLDGLAEGEYTIGVVAETAYGVQSKPVEQKVTVDGKTMFLNLFHRISLFFQNLFQKIKDLFY